MCTASPNNMIQASRATSPQTMNGRPRALMAIRTFGATRCRVGTGTSLRLAQNVSPSTARDAQQSIYEGGGNTCGLTASHRHKTATGTRQPPPDPAVGPDGGSRPPIGGPSGFLLR